MEKRTPPFLGTVLLMVWFAACVVITAAPVSAQTLVTGPKPAGEAVILLHGLARSKYSMYWIERSLRQKEYAVYNIGYPSLKGSIRQAADHVVATAVEACRRQGFKRIHFVTHSMGAIVLRCYLQRNDLPEGSRIVMLAPPNSGSEIVDWAQTRTKWFDRLVGPAAAQLNTAADSLPARLKPVKPAVGVLAGRKSWNPLFSAILPGEDDGKVSVRRTMLPEMQDFMVVGANHTTILFGAQVRRQILHFLQTGRFYRDTPL
jgi:pimeloyl-ACP methyl ester carboxylesterase